jgi:hypothetical protein
MRLLSKPWPITLTLLLAAAGAPITRAADPVPATQADPAADRLTFLTLQLSSIEASLHAINLALRSAGYKAVLTSEKADEAAKGNELMDRNGGAPVAWDKFYGATAKQFEPRDIVGIPHPYQRPSQFNYLYHANNDQVAKANAEVAALGQKVDTLLARRRQLDSEQSALWATISWESLQNHDISLNPLYRFQLKANTSTPATDARCDLLRPAILFLRTIDQTVADDLDSLSTNQAATLTDLKTRTEAAYAAAKEPLANAMLSADLSDDDLKTAKDLLTSLKHLAELSKNITEAYHLALDGDAAGDDNRKLTFRAQLQFALLDYATATGDLDIQLVGLAKSWDIEGERGVASHDQLPAGAGTFTPPAATASPVANAAAQRPQNRTIDLLRIPNHLPTVVSGIWHVAYGEARCEPSGDAKIDFAYTPPAEYDYRVTFIRTANERSIALICAAAGTQFSCNIGGGGNILVGFESINSQTLEAATPTVRKSSGWIENQKPIAVLVKVRKSGVEIDVDGQIITSYSRYADMTLPKFLKLSSPSRLGIDVYKSAALIKSAEVTEIR